MNIKYHKIRGIPKEVCTGEQMIAYNIAFRIHISLNGWDKNAIAIEKNRVAMQQRDLYIGMFKRDYPNNKCDIDGIFSALTSGLVKYLDNPKIATDYEQVGKMFPALYLNA